MIYTGLNRTGEIETIKTHGGGEIAEVYGGINYQNPIFYSRKTLTGTSPLTFKGLGQPLKDYHIFGETVQNGTPSPDYPVDVQGVGERTENLLDMTSQNIIDKCSLNRYGSEVSDGFFCVTDFLEVEPNTYYTINITNMGGGSHFSCFYDENKNFISSYRASGDYMEEKYTYLSPNNAKYIRCSLMSITRHPQHVASYMLTNTETIPPEYIPYGSEIYCIPVTIGNTTTPIYIGSDPLYRIGDYADEIDFANQQIVRRVKKLVLDGTENWAYTLNSVYPGWCSLIKSGDFPLLGVAPISTAFKGNSGGQGTEDIWHQPFNSITVSERLNTSSTSYNICLRAFNSTDRIIPSTIKGYFENKNLTLLYVLDTPTTESVTIPTLSTIAGDNTLTVDTTVKPFAVSITGNIKPTGYGQLIDVNDVDIQDSTGEPVYIQG